MMNKNVILFATCLLAFCAVWGTFAARKACEVEPIDLTARQKTRDKGQNAVSSANRPAPLQGQTGRLESADAKLDELWAKTLFKPERQEIEESQNAENLAEQQVNAEFELAGIASLGLPGKAEPVAIIRIRQNASRGNRGNAPRSMRGTPPGMGRGGGQPEQQQVQPTANVKTVFRKGEPIGNTGYTLAAIYPKEKMVELSRGRDVIKLYIEYNSELSQQRRKSAAAQEEAANRKREEEQQARMAEADRVRQQNQPAAPQANATGGGAQPARNAEDPALSNNAVPAADNPTPNRPPMPPGETAMPQGNGGSFRRNRQGGAPGGNGQRR